LYCVPNFHNPAGVSQTLERRIALLEIAERENLLVVEDNPYGLLGFDADPTPAMRSLEADRVIYLGSFSKTFAPGFRVGWVLAPHAVREKLVLAQESATLCPPAFSQYAISAYLANHDWRGQIKIFREMYRERRDAMLVGLADDMPAGTTWTVPAGGFFVWVTLPPGLDSHAMLPRAVTARVAYVPGTAFYADAFGSRHMRLSYCYPTPERIREGTRRLGEVLAYETGVLETFGAAAMEDSPSKLRPYEAPGANQA
jgi:DNA-binding transcriptional MocR family regulator